MNINDIIQDNSPNLGVMIYNGENINQCDAKGRFPIITAVSHAVANNIYSPLETLIQGNVDVNVYDTRGDTPLIIAVTYNNVRAIRLLLNAMADVNMGNRDSHDTPIMIAVSLDFLESVKIMMEMHADLHMKNIRGKTVFDIAKESKNEEIINLIQKYKKIHQ